MCVVHVVFSWELFDAGLPMFVAYENEKNHRWIGPFQRLALEGFGMCRRGLGLPSLSAPVWLTSWKSEGLRFWGSVPALPLDKVSYPWIRETSSRGRTPVGQ